MIYFAFVFYAFAITLWGAKVTLRSFLRPTPFGCVTWDLAVERIRVVSRVRIVAVWGVLSVALCAFGALGSVLLTGSI